MNATINKELIHNYLSGNSSALQKQMIDEWVKNSTNEELFYKWLVEYEYQHPQYLTNLSEATARFNTHADTVDNNMVFVLPVENKSMSNYHPRMKFWLAAASVIIILIMGSLIFKNNIIYQTHTTAFGETKSILLSDSTRVILNANSSLRVPRFGFGTKTREVFLTGEANFLVTHKSDNQKFMVKTDQGLEVVVFGTEFTVYTREKESKVVLNEGKVMLRYQEGKIQKQLTMNPGDLITFDKINHLKKEVTSQPEKYAAWKDHRFIFEDTTFDDFAEIMEENYGIIVITKDTSLAHRTLVGSFRADDADELLQIVSEVFNVNINRTGNTVVLTDNK